MKDLGTVMRTLGQTPSQNEIMRINVWSYGDIWKYVVINELNVYLTFMNTIELQIVVYIPELTGLIKY